MPAAMTLVVAVFFLSGASSLVYEVLWVRMFSLVFGNTTQAVSTVLTAFMGGLALGSFLFGRIADKHSRWSLAIYGGLEAVIGAYAFAVPVLIALIDSLHAWAYRTYHPSSWVFLCLRFFICIAILIIPTTMMGATLPLIGKFLVRQRGTLGYRIGILYGVNTAGAVVGCYLTGFAFIGSMGVTRTMYVAVAANAVIAAASIGLSLYFRSHQPEAESLDQPDQPAQEQQTSGPGERWRASFVLGCFAVAGLTSLCYEVLWTRVLVFFVGNSTYAFTSMLTTFLIGIAIGSLLFARFVDKARDRYMLFAAIEIIIAFWALFSVPLFTQAFYALGQSWQAFNIDLTWQSTAGFKFFKAFAVMFVPTLLMGAAFPVVCTIYSKDIGKVGRDVASVYSLNTVGGIIGSALAGYAIIPVLGVQKGIVAVAMLNLVLGIAVICLSGIGAAKKAVWAAVAMAMAVGGVLMFPTDRALRRFDEMIEELLFYREDQMAIVKVFRTPNGDKNISINGYIVAGSSTWSHEIQKGLAHLPMLLHEDPRDVLIVGFGAGGTSWSTTLYNPDKVDCVEFTPSVPKAAPYLDEVNHGVLSVPFYDVTIDDGRTFLLTTDRKFDVISIDAIDPKHSGSGSLYAVDFFELCRERVRPGGLVVEWLPYHLLTAEETRIVTASFASVFEHTTLWFTRYFNYLVLVGTDHEIEIDYGLLSQRLADPRIAADLMELEMDDPAEFLYAFAADTASIKEMSTRAHGLNTYDRPLIEYYTYHEGEKIGNLPFLERNGLPKIKNFGATPQEADRNRKNLERHLAAANHLIRAKGYDRETEVGKRVGHYRAALSLDPSDPVALRFGESTEEHLRQRIRRLRTLTQTNPTVETYTELAALYSQTGDNKAAVSMLENAVRLAPGSAELRLDLANHYEKIGRHEKAREQRKLARQQR
jgi:spermidine synthase